MVCVCWGGGCGGAQASVPSSIVLYQDDVPIPHPVHAWVGVHMCVICVMCWYVAVCLWLYVSVFVCDVFVCNAVITWQQ